MTGVRDRPQGDPRGLGHALLRLLTPVTITGSLLNRDVGTLMSEWLPAIWSAASARR